MINLGDFMKLLISLILVFLSFNSFAKNEYVVNPSSPDCQAIVDNAGQWYGKMTDLMTGQIQDFDFFIEYGEGRMIYKSKITGQAYGGYAYYRDNAEYVVDGEVMKLCNLSWGSVDLYLVAVDGKPLNRYDINDIRIFPKTVWTFVGKVDGKKMQVQVHLGGFVY
jgi:hypothetical protein